MACDNGRYFDGEFVALRVQIVVSKVEVSDTCVPVDGINYVSGALVTDSTVRDIKSSEGVRLIDISCKFAATHGCKTASSNVDCGQINDSSKLIYKWINVISELDRTHEVDLFEFVWISSDQLLESVDEGATQVVVSDRYTSNMRVHKD